MKKIPFASGLLALTFVANAAAQNSAVRPTVLELYTSQGCSSCPPADALLNALSDDPSLLPLSFHVKYWDYLGWKDPFASGENTIRQNDYAHLQGKRSVYTPQMVVDGTQLVVGSDSAQVHEAITSAQKNALNVPVEIEANASGDALDIHVGAQDMQHMQLPQTATVWAMGFTRRAVTPVGAGENEGRVLESVNNVVHITHLGEWRQSESHYRLPIAQSNEDGIAILVQSQSQGRVIGSAVYMKQ